MINLFTPEEQVEKENRYQTRKKEVLNYFRKEDFICNPICNNTYGCISKDYRNKKGKMVGTIWIQLIDSENYHDTENGVKPTGNGSINAYSIWFTPDRMEHYLKGQFAGERQFNMVEYLKDIEPAAQDFEKYKKWLIEWNNKK